MVKKIVFILISLFCVVQPMDNVSENNTHKSTVSDVPACTNQKEPSFKILNWDIKTKWLSWIAYGGLFFGYGALNIVAQRIKRKKTTFIGLVKISGPIMSASDQVTRIREYTFNPEVKGVLVEINSTGGLPGTSELIFTELKTCAQLKPVVVLVENFCCSGAYVIALAGDKIIAPAMGSIGSIGVALDLIYFTQDPQYIKYDPSTFSITYGTIKLQDQYAGSFKRVGSDFRPLNEEEKEYLKLYLTDTYDHFCSLVSSKRNVSLEKKHEWADGKILSGNQALKLGLIDAIGCRTDAIQALIILMQARFGEKNIFPHNVAFLNVPSHSLLKSLFLPVAQAGINMATKSMNETA